jgi:HK97 gp10 family phage protein
MGMTFDPSQLVANMEAIRERIVTQGARRAVVAGAKVIGEAMIERTPVQVEKTEGSDSLDPGEMKANIKVRSRITDGQPSALVGPTGKDGKIAKIAYNVEYGHRMVTGGGSKLGIDGKFHGGGTVHEKDVPPHAFLRPAFEASAAAAIDAVGMQFSEELKAGS